MGRILGRVAAASLLPWAVGCVAAARAAEPATPSPQSTDERFTPPPGEPTEQVAATIQRVEEALRGGRTTSEILADPQYLPLHEHARFRELIQRFTGTSKVKIVTPGEPGPPLVVTGRVFGRDGKPIAGARLYVYQTSSKGWYSDRAAHVTGPEGDRRHARLFGYLETDSVGGFELRTVRPTGYPGSDLPAHIHVEIDSDGNGPYDFITEILFEDDPRLTTEARGRAKEAGFVITSPVKEAGGPERVTAELKVR